MLYVWTRILNQQHASAVGVGAAAQEASVPQTGHTVDVETCSLLAERYVDIYTQDTQEFTCRSFYSFYRLRLNIKIQAEKKDGSNRVIKSYFHSIHLH